MSNANIRRIRRVALWIFVLTAIPMAASFFVRVDVNFGRRRATEINLISLIGSVAVNVDIFANPPAKSNWYFDVETKRVDLNKKYSPRTPVPGWHDYDYGFLTISDFRRGGVLVLNTYFLILPGFLLLLVLGSAITWGKCSVVQRRRRAWAAAQRCIKCGYDLQATPERCPECGTKVVPGFTPLSWYEPKWSFDVRKNSPKERVMRRQAAIVLFIIFGLITAPFLVIWFADASIISAMMYLLLVVPLIWVCQVRWLRPPRIVLDERYVKVGPNPAMLGLDIQWKLIQATAITRDDQGRPLLWLVLRDDWIERAIAPEVDLNELQKRLTFWAQNAHPVGERKNGTEAQTLA
jgi:hypothetical protein